MLSSVQVTGPPFPSRLPFHLDLAPFPPPQASSQMVVTSPLRFCFGLGMASYYLGDGIPPLARTLREVSEISQGIIFFRGLVVAVDLLLPSSASKTWIRAWSSPHALRFFFISVLFIFHKIPEQVDVVFPSLPAPLRDFLFTHGLSPSFFPLFLL